MKNHLEDETAIPCSWCGEPELYGNTRCGYCGHNPLNPKELCDCRKCMKIVHEWRRQKRKYQNPLMKPYRHLWPGRNRKNGKD